MDFLVLIEIADFLRACHICDRTWEKGPLRVLLQNRLIGIQRRLKAIICGIFFVLVVTCCGVLAVSVQSLLAYSFKIKSRKH